MCLTRTDRVITMYSTFPYYVPPDNNPERMDLMILTYRRLLLLWACLLAILTIPTITPAGEPSSKDGLTACLSSAMADLGVQPANPNLCVLTNAPYVKQGAESAARCLDVIQDTTGCSHAKKNLLFYHACVSNPLRIVLFDKGSGKGVALTGARNGSPLTDPCSPVAATASKAGFEKAKLVLGGKKILEADAFKEVMKRLGPAEGFSIASILDAWAGGVPFDFLKACEFHNHFCPGVTSGYLIVKMINEKYPLEKGQKYVWIGSPPKCGDDAIQVLLDLTPGKRTCFIKGLSPAQRKKIKVEEPLNNVQGILVVWDNKANKGKGVVFKYNWGKVCEIAGLKFSDFRPPKGRKDPRFFTTRLKGNRAVMPYLDKPAELVGVAVEIDVSPEMYMKLISAGSNPYEAAGLTAE